MTPLEVVLKSIQQKKADYDTRFWYFDGVAPLKYSMDRIRRVFANQNVYFAQNWAGVIVSAVSDRMILNTLSTDKDGKDELEQIFKTTGLNLDSHDAHESALVTSEGFIIVDVNEGEIETYWNDPRNCVMVYDPARPKQKLFAGKLWMDADKLYHVNIYYPDRIEEYTSKSTTAGSFKTQLADRPNELGEIPVFHFRTSQRTNKTELDRSAMSICDGINHLFANMMASAELNVYKTKVVIANQDPGNVKMSPDSFIYLPSREGKDGQDTQVAEIGGQPLSDFIEPMNSLANMLSATTRTPKHYFFSQGDVPSGDALNSMEAPLVRKVNHYEQMFGATWQELGQFLLKVHGINVNREDITPVWQPAETVQPLAMAQTISTYKSAGVPLRVAAKKVGWNEVEISGLPAKSDTVSTPQNVQNQFMVTGSMPVTR